MVYRRKSMRSRRRRSRSKGRSMRRSRRRSGSSQWITRPGKLGGPGFLSKSSKDQHRLLDKCVREYGYRSCLGSVMVLQRSRSINSKYGSKLNSLKNYLKRKYGRN
jgi:hypothetical protein